MPYIGNPPVTQFASLDYQDLTGVTGVPSKRGYTLNSAVGSANDIEVFVNNVRQEPGVAYTVSGTTLTMTGDVETTDDFYVVFQGKAVGTASHPAGNALEATSGTFTGNVSITGTTSSTGTITATAGIIVPSGQGIDFSATSDGGGTMSNELLQDYERGSWTPIDVSGAGLSFTVTSAEYVKIGDLVSFQLYITYPTTSNSSTSQIGGLPYTVGTGYYYMSGRVQGQSANDLTAQIQQSNTTIGIYYNNGGLQNSTLSGDYIIMSGTYIAA